MDKQLERSYGALFLYMVTAVRLLYAQGGRTYNGKMVGEVDVIRGNDEMDNFD